MIQKLNGKKIIIITNRFPNDLPEFCLAIIKALAVHHLAGEEGNIAIKD